MSTASSASSSESTQFSKRRFLSPVSGEKIKKNILVGCTGSVAALKIPILTKLLLEQEKYNIKVVTTNHAKHFFDVGEMTDVELLTDEVEWDMWKKRGDPVVHIDLAKWANLFVIAPLDANTLGKIANGLCDNLLTSVARAWNFEKPFVICPAMNTKMYEHPVTSEQISKLLNWGCIQVPVIEKVLICGDKGAGAMAEVETILKVVNDILENL